MFKNKVWCVAQKYYVNEPIVLLEKKLIFSKKKKSIELSKIVNELCIPTIYDYCLYNWTEMQGKISILGHYAIG